MSTSSPAPRYDLAAHAAQLPERQRDRFAFFASRWPIDRVMYYLRNARVPHGARP